MNVIPATIDYLGIYHMPEYYPAVIGTVASIVVIVVVSARGKVSREEKTYRMRLHQTPASEIDRVKTIKTLFAPLGLIVYGCVMPVLLLQYYVIPYQIGTGEANRVLMVLTRSISDAGVWCRALPPGWELSGKAPTGRQRWIT